MSRLHAISLNFVECPRSLRVSLQVDYPPIEAGAPILEQTQQTAGVRTPEPLNLRAWDATGELKIVRHSADNGEFGGLRQWVVDRDVKDSYFVQYESPADARSDSAQPPVALRRDAGGLSGAGTGFLAVPPPRALCDLRVTWDVSDPSRTGVCSLGAGTARATGSSDSLMYSYYMTGPTLRCRSYENAVRVWDLGGSSQLLDVIGNAVSRVQEYLAGALGVSQMPAMEVFIRSSAGAAISAVALRDSVVIDVGQEVDPGCSAVLRTIAHELVHGWVQLSGETHDVAWFNEGIAEYLSVLALADLQMIDHEDVKAFVDAWSGDAFGNHLRDVKMRRLAPQLGAQPAVRRVIYARGFFYFAELDSWLADRGTAPGLVYALRQLRAQQRAGVPIDVDGWYGLLSVKSDIDRGALERLLDGLCPSTLSPFDRRMPDQRS